MRGRQSGFKANTIRPVRKPSLRRLGPALLFFVALSAGAQTPTPTPTPTATETPTPTPTATPVPATGISAGVTLYTLPTGSPYDAANLILDSDGSVWTASGRGNVITHVAADGSSLQNWSVPAPATPSSLLRDADGSFWFTELGGFNVGHLDTATNTLTQWPDQSRRPTSLIRRPDGMFWLPETGGLLSLFDPVASTYTYFTPVAYTLSYPWMDPDGSLFTCDFSAYAILRFSADGTSVTRWNLPTNLYYIPSKIRRMPDDGLWISFWGSGQLGRFDDKTNELRIYDLPSGSSPYDLQPYRGRILYSEQSTGQIAFYDPAVGTPSATVTLSPDAIATTSVTIPSIPGTQTVTTASAAPTAATTENVGGLASPTLTQIPASNGSPIWGVAIDERRARIWFNTSLGVGIVLPTLPVNAGDLFLPLARSSPGPGERVYRTDTVLWNRGTPNASNATTDLPVWEILLPNGWIAGFQPTTSPTVPARQLLAQTDPIGGPMSAPGSLGTLRFSVNPQTSDLFVASRTATTRDDGGTYGFALNGVGAPDAIGPGQSAFVFTPPGDFANLVNAGLVVLEASTGTISLLDAGGADHHTYHYNWPAGFSAEGTTIWEAFGIPPIPGGRIAFAPATGKIFPFGVAFDGVTGDPTGLAAMAPGSAATVQTIPFVMRGGGPLGPSSRTDLQLANTGSVAASVTLALRPATSGDGPPPADVPLPAVSVPPGNVVSLSDVLAAAGLAIATGALEVSADQPVFAFARVWAAADGGGSYGYGSGSAPALGAGSRGVFLGVTQNAAFESDLVLLNQSGDPASMTVNLAAADGTAAGTLNVTLAPREIRTIPSVWSAVTGAGVDAGRLEVVPADGTGSVAATILRSDLKTLDADSLVPLLMPR